MKDPFLQIRSLFKHNKQALCQHRYKMGNVHAETRTQFTLFPIKKMCNVIILLFLSYYSHCMEVRLRFSRAVAYSNTAVK